MVEYSEWLLGEVLKNVPHRQWVFSIPKRLRIYFLYDRKLLSKLSRCGWNVIRKCLETTSLGSRKKRIIPYCAGFRPGCKALRVGNIGHIHRSEQRSSRVERQARWDNSFFPGPLDEDAKPGASIAVHTYGDFLNFNPHLHGIVPDGCFLGDSDFRMAPMITGKDPSEAFRHEILSMLKKEGKITDTVIENMMSWHHSGFHVHIGERIWPEDQPRHWRGFSQERIVYIPGHCGK